MKYRVLIFVVFWALALGLFAIFRFFGLDDDQYFNPDSYRSDQPFILMPFVVLSIFGALLGFAFYFIEGYFEKKVVTRVTLGLSILLKTLAYLAASVLFLTLVLQVVSTLLDFDINLEVGWWLADKTVWALLIYILLLSFLFALIKMGLDHFGRGVFTSILFGKFRTPKEEARIFMFIDLKGSTNIAESLGHQKYTYLIQDCFLDLNLLVDDYHAQIYQYVGDEVVLYWNIEEGQKNQNCINLFLAFERALLAKKDHYMKHYGMLPQFKAGVHGGNLMVTEVGLVKKELAYHGDVINTASRIQGKCNTYGQTLLFSKFIYKLLGLSNQAQNIGSEKLRGKEDVLDLYTLA